MHTQKIAITMPTDLVAVIDEISRLKGVSRSGFISAVLKEKIALEKEKQVKNEYDRIFSDETIQEEQLEWTRWFEQTGSREGQEW
jgi:metal-responsive CopG/Arc/MetJ family transcriptional regulator